MRPTRLLFAALIGLVFTVRANAQELNLGERVQPLPTANRFSVPGYHVWCGAPVKGPDDRYHLFYSRWPVEVGFAPGWGSAFRDRVCRFRQTHGPLPTCECCATSARSEPSNWQQVLGR